MGSVVLNAYGKKKKYIECLFFFFEAVVKVVQGVSLHVQTVMELCAAFPAEPFALIYDSEDVTDIQANYSVKTRHLATSEGGDSIIFFSRPVCNFGAICHPYTCHEGKG